MTASIVIFLLLLEGISTVLTNWIKFPPIFVREYNLEGNFIRDFDIGYVNKPNACYTSRTKMGICYYRINAQGLRSDSEVTKHKSENEYRILCIGDSTVFGLDVDQSETFPYQLESILNRRGNGTHYCVLNAGCPSYTSFQVMRYTEAKLRDLNPDMIVIAVGVNDAKLRDSEKSRDYRSGPLPFFRRLIFPTNTYLIISYLKSLFIPIKGIQASDTPAVDTEDYAENLGQVLDMADAIGATVIFCPISVPGKYRSVLREISNSRGVKIVDAEESLWRAYSDLKAGSNKYTGIRRDPKVHEIQQIGVLKDETTIPYFYTIRSNNLVMIDSVHPNPIGNRAIAEDLAKIIP